MKNWKHLRWLLLFFATILQVCASQENLTPDETKEIKQKLEAFDKGLSSFEQLAEWTKDKLPKLAAYYYAHTNEVSVKMKLPVSRALVASGAYAEGAALAKSYVNVYSNDWYGWRVIGAAKLALNDPDAAVDAYVISTQLGDDTSVIALGSASLAAGRLEIFKQMVLPHFIADKDKKDLKKSTRLTIIRMLVGYSLLAKNEEVFVNALEGLSASDIPSQDALREAIIEGYKKFSSKEVKHLYDSLK